MIFQYSDFSDLLSLLRYMLHTNLMFPTFLMLKASFVKINSRHVALVLVLDLHNSPFLFPKKSMQNITSFALANLINSTWSILDGKC